MLVDYLHPTTWIVKRTLSGIVTIKYHATLQVKHGIYV